MRYPKVIADDATGEPRVTCRVASTRAAPKCRFWDEQRELHRQAGALAGAKIGQFAP